MNNNVWAAPKNLQQTVNLASGSSQTLTLNTPQAHSLLICVVAWTGVTTVSVAGGTGNVWASKPQITNGTNNVQFWYCLDGHNVATTLTATFSGTSTNIQMFDAEYPVNISVMSISAASQSGSVTTFTCSNTNGFTTALTPGMPISITGMADAGNNTGGSNPAQFIIQSASGGPPTTSFTVNNPNGVTRAGQTGTGIVGSTEGISVAVVNGDVHTATGSSATPASGSFTPVYANELYIGYFDWGTYLASATAGSNYNFRSTITAPTNARAGWEDALNTSGGFVSNASCNIASNPWEAGMIGFYASMVGTAPSVPTVETAAQQALLIATTNPKYTITTDPYGANNASGPSKVGQIYPTGRN